MKDVVEMLHYCAENKHDCEGCEYRPFVLDCSSQLMIDAANEIEKLRKKVEKGTEK